MFGRAKLGLTLAGAVLFHGACLGSSAPQQERIDAAPPDSMALRLSLEYAKARAGWEIRVEPKPISSDLDAIYPSAAVYRHAPESEIRDRAAVIRRVGLRVSSMFPLRECTGRNLPSSMKRLADCPETPFIQMALSTPRVIPAIPDSIPAGGNVMRAGGWAVRVFSTDYDRGGSSTRVYEVIFVRGEDGWTVLGRRPVASWD